MKNLTTTEFTTLILSASALIVSILAIAGSIYTYCVHDAELKKQEKRINDDLLGKIDEEKVRQKQAKIKAEIVSKSGTRFIVQITNFGSCEAKDLKIEAKVHEEDGIQIDTNSFPLELLGPGEHIEFKLFQINTTSPDFIVLNFTWTDEFKNDNKYSTKLFLN